jgi:hypothetical protein
VVDRSTFRGRRLRSEIVGLGAVFAAAALVPWIAVLAIRLPAHHQAHHWRLTWVGFDVLLLVGFLAVGDAGLRRAWWLPEAAAATATALLIDAWFDVSTAGGGGETAVALLLAALVEVPVAVGLLSVAVRAKPVAAASSGRSSRGQARHLRLIPGGSNAHRAEMTHDELHRDSA